MLAQNYVKENHVPLFDILLKMVNHQNFFAKREALKLLNTLLRDEYLKEVLQYFVSSVVFPSRRERGIEENLKLIMTLLLDQTKAVQFEAFGLHAAHRQGAHKVPANHPDPQEEPGSTSSSSSWSSRTSVELLSQFGHLAVCRGDGLPEGQEDSSVAAKVDKLRPIQE